MYDWARMWQGAGGRGQGHKKVCIRYVIIRISQKIIITFGHSCGRGGWKSQSRADDQMREGCSGIPR